MKRFTFFITLTPVLLLMLISTHQNSSDNAFTDDMEVGDIRVFCNTCQKWSDEADHYV